MEGLGSPVWLTISLFIVQLLMGIVIALVAFFMKTIVANMSTVTKDLRELAGELKEFQLSVAHTGVMREHFEQYRQETRQRLHEIGDKAAAAEGAATTMRQLMSDYVFRQRASDAAPLKVG